MFFVNGDLVLQFLTLEGFPQHILIPVQVGKEMVRWRHEY